MSDFMAAVNQTFWLHIRAEDEKQAQHIVSAVYSRIRKYIEEEHGNAQGEMLAGEQSKICQCTRDEAWKGLEKLELSDEIEAPFSDYHSFARYLNAVSAICDAEGAS